MRAGVPLTSEDVRLAKQSGPELQHHQCLLDRGEDLQQPANVRPYWPSGQHQKPRHTKTQTAGQSGASVRISSEITDFP